MKEYKWSQMTWEEKITLIAAHVFDMQLEKVNPSSCVLVNGEDRRHCGPPSDYMGSLDGATWTAEAAVKKFGLPAVWEVSRSAAEKNLYRAVIRDEHPAGPYIHVFGHAEMDQPAEALCLATLRATGLRVIY